jgi:PAS domain S-box-containing protein
MKRRFSTLPSLIRTRLVQWLKLPRGPQPVLAESVEPILRLMLVGQVIAVIVLPLTYQSVQNWIVLASAICTAVACWIARRGQTHQAGLIGLINILLLTTALLTLGEGLLDIAILLYPAIIIASVLLLNQRQFIYLMVLMLLGLGLVFYGQLTGWVSSLQPIRERQLSDFIMAVVILSVTAASTYLLSENLRRSLSRLTESEARFRVLVEQTSVVIYRDAPAPGMPALYISPRIEVLLGYTSEEWTREPLFWHSLLHPDDRERILEIAADMSFKAYDDTATFEYRLKSRDGRWVWVRDESVVVRDTAGRPHYIQGVYSDVTERHQTEQALHESEERFRLLAQASPDTIYVIDTATRQVTYMNRAGLLGYSRSELEQEYSIFHAVHPADATLVRTLWWGTLVGQAETLEYRLRSRKGDWEWVQQRAAVLQRRPDGTPAEVMFIVTITTERKQAEAALQSYSERMATLNNIGRAVTTLQKLPEALETIYHQVQGSLLLDFFFIGLYDPATELVDFPLVYDGGQRYEELPRPLMRQTNTRLTIEARQPRLINRTEVEIREHVLGPFALGDKSKPSASLMFAPLFAGDHVIGVISAQSYAPSAYTAEHLAWLVGAAHFAAIAIENARLFQAQQHELRERQRAEELVRQFNAELERRVAERTAELEATNRELESIAYTIAHDLRIPVRAMHGFAHVLKEDLAPLLEAQARHHLQRIIENARHMGQLVDDLLEFMRLSRAPLRPHLVNMYALAAEVITNLQAEHPARAVAVQIAELPECWADAALLQTVWRSLLSNAFKYTRSCDVARIEVGMLVSGSEPVYFVRDNGVGFDMRYVDKLFNVFQRLHRAEEFEGTGVGLAIVHRIIHRHGGRIWAEAEVDKGATFYFTLGPFPEGQ